MTQWIRVESALIRHPKVLLLAARLKKNCYEVVGRLVALWSWASERRDSPEQRRVAR